MSNKLRSSNEYVDLVARIAAGTGAITMASSVVVFCSPLTLPAVAISAAVLRRTYRD